MQYRAEIDGLRAIAVIPVLLFHAGLAWFQGGFVGVDVFFVISGYLITSIILEEIDRGKFTIASFYERRARRILPALVLVSALCIPAAWLLMNRQSLADFGDALIGTAFFTANFVFFLKDGYFDENFDLSPLIHMWSLAVEEQFYIFYPILLIVLAFVMRRHLWWVILLITALSLTLSIVVVDVIAVQAWINGAFFLLPARVWELGAGALCAMPASKLPAWTHGRRYAGHFAGFGIALILAPILLYDATTPFPGMASVPPVLGTCLIIIYARNANMPARWLGWMPIVLIGQLSFSLYLFHQPLLAFYRVAVDRMEIAPVAILALLGLSGLLSYASWRFVEAPFRNRSFLTRKTVFATSVAALLALAGAGWATQIAGSGAEEELAEALTHTEFVTVGNLDERRFVAARIDGPLDQADAVVMGSSRLMNASSDLVGSPIFNASVSGAAMEDMVALLPSAVEAVGARQVYLGIDPWTFNAESGQDRWREVADRYEAWRMRIDCATCEGPAELAEPPAPGAATAFLRGLYDRINMNEVTAADGEPGAVNKLARDGALIYQHSVIARTPDEVAKTLPAVTDYGMQTYRYDAAAERSLRSLIRYLTGRGIAVTLVLTPYHPAAYPDRVTYPAAFERTERRIRDIARELDVAIAGSYDPETVNCGAGEFYDALHARPSCLEKILR